MAIRREKAPRTGRYGRVSPAPHGSIYVRDETAAVAAALKEKAELFESLGLEVPEYLAQQVAEAGEAGEAIVQVEADAVTQDAWRLIDEDDQFGETAPEPVEEPAVEEPVVEAVEVEAEAVEVEAEVVEEAVEEAPKPRRRSTKKADSSEE